jgi:hypothetical protein
VHAVWYPANVMQFGILPLQFGILPLQFGILPLQFSILPLQFGILHLQFGILPRCLINVSPRTTTTTTTTTTTKQNLDPRCTNAGKKVTDFGYPRAYTGCPVNIQTDSFKYNFFCDRTISKNLISK